MTAEIMAWRECIASPKLPAEITMLLHGQGITLRVEEEESLAYNKLIASGDVFQHGLLYIDPAEQEANVKTIVSSGVHITAKELFDMTILDEVYQEHPKLKPVPKQGTIAGIPQV